jgi:hypothetical protein
MHHRRKTGLPLALSLILATLLTPAMAQDDRAAERAARRQQQQLQQLQQQMTQAQAEKAKAEADRAAAEKQLADRARVAARASAAERAAAERQKLLEAEKAQLLARVAELEQAALAQRAEAEAALARKEAELAQAAAAFRSQGGERDQWQQRFGEQVRLVTSCTDKNERLVKLSAELLSRWQDKGVMDALKQREPLLGLGDVQMFNLVQDYRDKTDNEKFVPRLGRE